MNKATEKKRVFTPSFCFECMSSLVVALVLVVLVFTFLFRTVTVSGHSMHATLRHGDCLILVTALYTPQRGDVVVIDRAGDEPLIKRVIAVAGDTVAIDEKNGKVLLNDQVLDEPYVFGGFTPSMGFDTAYTVQDNEVFALGDNRVDSLDSRQLGAFSVKDIVGEAVFRLLPLPSMGSIG